MAVTKNTAKMAGKSLDTSEVNNTNNTDAGIAGSDDMEASGAIIEDGAKDMVDMKHPSVDDNPRKDTTKAMNQIDFNEPSGLTPPEEVVAKALKANG